MKELYLLGYSPANKDAWPQGKLDEQLQALDIRHGVCPNLVMTPLLSAACKLPKKHQVKFLEYVERHILDTGETNHRFNVLSKNVGGDPDSTLDAKVKKLFGKKTSDAEKSNRIFLVFSYWATTALMSYLIQGRKQWSKKDLRDFGKTFIEAVKEDSNLKDIFGLPERLPRNIIPRHGLLFRILTTGEDQLVNELLGQAINRIRNSSDQSSLSEQKTATVVANIRAIIPIPHNEVYQNYRTGSNPIGKYQACFVECKDSKELSVNTSSKLMWEHVGMAIAKKLVSGEK